MSPIRSTIVWKDFHGDVWKNILATWLYVLANPLDDNQNQKDGRFVIIFAKMLWNFFRKFTYLKLGFDPITISDGFVSYLEEQLPHCSKSEWWYKLSMMYLRLEIAMGDFKTPSPPSSPLKSTSSAAGPCTSWTKVAKPKRKNSKTSAPP